MCVDANAEGRSQGHNLFADSNTVKIQQHNPHYMRRGFHHPPIKPRAVGRLGPLPPRIAPSDADGGDEDPPSSPETNKRPNPPDGGVERAEERIKAPRAAAEALGAGVSPVPRVAAREPVREGGDPLAEVAADQGERSCSNGGLGVLFSAF